MGKKVSFEIDTNAIEGLAHQTELTLYCDPPTESELARDSLEELRTLTRGTRNRVEMTQSLGKATMPKDRIELVKASTPLPIDPEEEEEEEDQISLKFYKGRGIS